MTRTTATRRKKTAPPSTVRVAIYCRQSVTDDKDFGSLEAQREAVESYVRSQPGWRALPDCWESSIRVLCLRRIIYLRNTPATSPVSAPVPPHA